MHKTEVMRSAGLGSPSLVRILSLVVGFGMYHAWATSTILTAQVMPQSTIVTTQYMWLISAVAHAISLICCFLLARRITVFSRCIPMLVFFPLSVIIGTWFMWYTPGGSAALFVLGAALTGMGNAGIVIFWGEQLVNLPSLSTQTSVVIGSVFVGFILQIAISFLPEDAAKILVLMFPLISIACLRYLLSNGLSNDYKKPIMKSHAFPVELAVFCILFAIPSSLYRETNAGGGATNWVLIFGLATILIIALAVIDYMVTRNFQDTVDFERAFRFIVSLMVGGLLTLPFLSGDKTTVAGVLLLTGQFLFMVYFYSEFAAVSRRNKLLPAQVFAIGIVFVDIGIIIGSLAAMLLRSLSQSISIGIILAIVYVIFMFSLFFSGNAKRTIGKKKTSISMSTHTVDSPHEKPLQQGRSADAVKEIERMKDSIDACCSSLSDRYQLTHKETEILRYLVRGRSVQSIAEEIFVSENTIKTHMRHLYQKLDVHNREELMRLLNTDY